MSAHPDPADQTPRSISFANNLGDVIHLDGNLTIEDLAKMGVDGIKLSRDGAALNDHWWRGENADSPSNNQTRLPAQAEHMKPNP